MNAAAKIAVAVVALLAITAGYLIVQWRSESDIVGQWSTIDRYCIDCHNGIDLSGNLALDSMTVESIADHPEVFETAVRKLRGRMMPPPGEPVPTESEYREFIALLESQLDAAAR